MNPDSLKRIFAILALIILGCTFISLIINLIKGPDPGVILAHLFVLMIIPCIFYAIRLLANVISKNRDRFDQKPEN